MGFFAIGAIGNGMAIQHLEHFTQPGMQDFLLIHVQAPAPV